MFDGSMEDVHRQTCKDAGLFRIADMFEELAVVVKKTERGLGSRVYLWVCSEVEPLQKDPILILATWFGQNDKPEDTY